MALLQLGRHLAPPRFILFLLLLPIGFFAHRQIFHPREWTDSATIAFDIAAAVFVASLIPLLREQGPEVIRRHADANDANRVLVLVVTALLTVAVMVAIAGELDDARKGDLVAAGKLVATLSLIWLFANSVFALHYAHDYYTEAPKDAGGGGSSGAGGSGGDCGGLDFPGTDEPSYGDFAYFSFTLGMTFQTSDVSITARRVRGIAVLHCLAAFVFNIGVIAFTINALGGGS